MKIKVVIDKSNTLPHGTLEMPKDIPGPVIYESCSACGHHREKFVGEQKDSVSNKARIGVLEDRIGEFMTRFDCIENNIDRCENRIDRWAETLTRYGRLIEALGESVKGIEKSMEAMAQPVCVDCFSSNVCGLDPPLPGRKCDSFKHPPLVDNAPLPGKRNSGLFNVSD